MFDFIIIGSGFGGSVAALRLAEKGYRVALFEKGRRYRPEDFPRTSWNLRKFLWMPQMGCYGIQCLTLLKHVFILHGSGVGGGSLVYANQLLTPPDPVFEKPEWGPGNWKARLAPYYQEARRMLAATPSPSVGVADHILADIGKHVRGKDTFHVNDVGVFFGEPGKTVPDPYFDGRGPARTGCTLCSACMTGCRDGGKNTLDKNYLFLAEQMGVQVFAETEVVAVRPRGSGYTVRTRTSTGIRKAVCRYNSRGVIFSGGVLGTVKLLMHCKEKGYLPRLSNSIGLSVRTNSEAILGARSRNPGVNYADHIAITSGIYPDPQTHMQVVRYRKGSDAMGLLTAPLTDGGMVVPRWKQLARAAMQHPVHFLRAVWPLGWARQSAILLVMQTSENQLRFDYAPRAWRLGRYSLNSKLPGDAERIPTHIPIANKVTRLMADRIDGMSLGAWTDALFEVPMTAHILGGAVMGENKHTGVTDFSGQVFGYPNLYIADGSVVPVNLGVNPALTIAALAEYIMSNIPPKRC